MLIQIIDRRTILVNWTFLVIFGFT